MAGKSAYIVATLSGWSGAPDLLNIKFTATGGPDGFVRNVRIYRLADEVDLLAGNVYRTAHEQQFIDHDPSALRLDELVGRQRRIRYAV